MNVAAVLLMICMFFVSVLPGKGQSMQEQVKMECCKKMGKDMPCNHQQKQDCKHGMCFTRYCCNVNGFVPVEAFSLSYNVSIPASDLTVPYLEGMLSDYVSKSFRPPRV